MKTFILNRIGIAALVAGIFTVIMYGEPATVSGLPSGEHTLPSYLLPVFLFVACLVIIFIFEIGSFAKRRWFSKTS